MWFNNNWRLFALSNAIIYVNYHILYLFSKLKGEVKVQRDETITLRKALQECKACKIKKPECGDDPPPCFPRVECRDTYDGPVCGPCPQGFKGDGRVK